MLQMLTYLILIIMKTLKYLFVALAWYSSTFVLCAQNLSSGIYPEPQEVTISSQLYTPTHGYALRGIANPDVDAVGLLKEVLPFAQGKKSLPLEIKKIKDKRPELTRSGAYILTITKKGITIEIVDNRSLFYAAQTLKQLVGFNDEGKRTLPLCTLTDYPDVAFRGTVEGFYGEPWSHADRLEQIRFYGQLKMNTYIYGPKDDPYHSSPNWREPYPAEQARHIRELTEAASRNKVDFVWAIHPGQDIQWNRADSLNLLSKFEKMYDLGVRAFAVFFDDIAGEGTRADKQAGLLNYIQQEFVNKKEGVRPLIVCPTEYNRILAKTDYLDILGAQLDPAIQIMWTGNGVVDDITLESLEWANQRLGRPAFVWWNFPVSDYCRDHLLMGPVYGLDTHASKAMSGFVSNPMEWAEASKVALFGVAMYTWNMHRFDSQKAWENACTYIMPEADVAFRTFCEHNCDPGPNGHQYRREESARFKSPLAAFQTGYRAHSFYEKEANQLGAMFSQITMAPNLIYSQSKNKRIIQQINPWLIQFELLGKTGTAALHMAHAWYEKDRAATWQRYLEVTSLLDSMKIINQTFNQNAYQSGVKTGSQLLVPFINELYRRTSFNLLSTPETSSEEVQGNIPSIFTNVDQLAYLPCIENDNTVRYTPVYEVVTLHPQEYIGLGWEIQKEAASFHFNLPLSNQAGRLFEWSADGKTWTAFSDLSTEHVKGTVSQIDPRARYIRMRNTSDRDMDLYVLNFAVTTKESPVLNEALMIYDMNLATYKILKPEDKIEIKCSDAQVLSFYLSGDNENLILIVGTDSEGEKQIIYQGNVGYIKLNRSLFENIQYLELSTIGKNPVQLHEVVREL